MPTHHPSVAAIYGIDLGKTRFDVVASDTAGKPLQRVKLTRHTILPFFEAAPLALIGMEACPGAQWLARKLAAMGHTVRIIPAQFVKPFVKSNKNDARDAEAIAEAVVRPTMRFAGIKSEAQVDLQALHRVRDRLVANRTQLICQMRAFCLEYGIAMRQGAGVFKLDIARVMADQSNDLTPMMRAVLQELWEEFAILDSRLLAVTRQVEAIASRLDAARRLMTIPGIGPLSATAIVAAVGDGRQFRKARDLAAWLGLVPRQNSTGGKTTLLGISKRGNPYLRRLIIHGARSCVTHLNREHDKIGEWLNQLEQRMHRNKVIVAFANKIARMVWAVLTKPGNLYKRVDPAHAR
jgi:transposase